MDLTHEVHDDEPDRVFVLEVMDASYHSSTSYASAGKMLYNGPHHEDMLALLNDTFMADLQFGDRPATRDHLMNKLNDKL